MKREDQIKILPQYSYVEEVERETMPFSRECIVEHEDDLQHLIYAPDPETGFPCSQIPVNVQKNADPEVREYINKYMQPHNSSPSSVTDIKDAFAAIGNRYAQYGSEVDDEIERLKVVVKDTVKSKLQT